MIAEAFKNIILEKYSSTPTYRVGLSITETVISSVDDTSLLDNALGTPNYTAPGANRYKIDLVLSRKNIFEAGVPVVSSGMTFTEAVNTVTVTTSTDHNLANGDFVIVSTGDFMDGSIEDMMKTDKDMKIILENSANQKKLLLNEQIKVNKWAI